VDTPLQIRRPGLLSALPPDKRGRFGYCPDHAADADAKLAAAIGVGNHHPSPGREGLQPQPQPGGKVRQNKHDPGKQGTLI
jgi:hypothetical protein